MKKILIPTIVVILFTSLYLLQAAEEGPNVKWEYQVLRFSDLYRQGGQAGRLDRQKTSDSQLPILLNVQGALGWELCALIDESDDRWIFKRRLPDEE